MLSAHHMHIIYKCSYGGRSVLFILAYCSQVFATHTTVTNAEELTIGSFVSRQNSYVIIFRRKVCMLNVIV